MGIKAPVALADSQGPSTLSKTLLKLKGRTAVVTGAASGIGRAIAASLARRGCNVALADIDDAALAHVATEIGAADVRVSRHCLDVADRDAVAAFPSRVISEHGSVDVLVNNPGVALGGTFLEIAERDFEWLFEINFWGVVRMTRAFLPHLQKSEEAWLVNLNTMIHNKCTKRAKSSDSQHPCILSFQPRSVISSQKCP